MLMAQRPTFLSIICILLALYGVFILLVGVMLAAFGGSGALSGIADDIGLEFAEAFLIGFGIGLIVIGLLALLAVYLLWNGKTIGWYLAVIFLAINAISGIFMLPAGILSLVVTVLLIVYFFRPNVKAFFDV